MPIPPDLDPDEIDAAHDDDDVDGVQHGKTHARRPEIHEALRGQGLKTRARNRAIAQGRAFKG